MSLCAPSLPESLMPTESNVKLLFPDYSAAPSCAGNVSSTPKEGCASLSYLDVLMSSAGTGPLLYRYQGLLDKEKMESSLRKTLVHFPDLCGRMRARGKLGVDGRSVVEWGGGKGKGVKYTYARFSEESDVGPSDVTGKSVHMHFPKMISADGPLVHIQLTHFESVKKSTLAVVVCHGLADGASAFTFLRTWAAEFAKDTSYPAPRFEAERALKMHSNRSEVTEYGTTPTFKYKEAETTLKAIEKDTSMVSRTPLVIGRLIFRAVWYSKGKLQMVTFNDKELKALKDAATAEAKKIDPSLPFLSTNDVMMAHMFVSVRRPQLDQDRKMGMDGKSAQVPYVQFGVNMRPFMDMPDSYMGNVLGLCSVSIPREAVVGDMSEDVGVTVGRVASMIRKKLKSDVEDGFLQDSVDRLVEFQHRHPRQPVTIATLGSGFLPEDRGFGFTSWCKFNWYEVEFGTGMAEWFGPSLDTATRIFPPNMAVVYPASPAKGGGVSLAYSVSKEVTQDYTPERLRKLILRGVTVH